MVEEQQTEQQQQPTIKGFPTFSGQLPYESEWLHNKAALRSMEFIPPHLADIGNSGLSYSCTKTLGNRAIAMFSNTVVLSNLTGIKQVSGLFGMNVQNLGYNDRMAEIDFELQLVEDRAGYRRSDISNPHLSRLENIQRGMFKFMLTRTKGGDREGIQQHRLVMKSEQEVHQSMTPSPMMQPEKKKLFGIF